MVYFFGQFRLNIPPFTGDLLSLNFSFSITTLSGAAIYDYDVLHFYNNNSY